MALTAAGSVFLSPVPARLRRISSALRVLYVDPSPDNVSILVRNLDRSTSWDVTHADSATAALEIAKRQGVDVALLHTPLPGIDVIETANSLTLLHPKLTTFILSDGDDATQEAYSSGRFQLFPKSASIPELVAAVERMASLVSWLSNATTLELVSGIHSLPSIPSNYQGVIRTIHSSDASIQDIGEAINKDMGMTSRVLQVANSAFYGYSKKITNPTEAAQLLGIETLKSLVRYSHVLNNFPQTPASNAIFEKVWRHSVGVAGSARQIARAATGNESLAEEAFTAGLLHDIGKLLLISLKPDVYKEAIRQSSETKSPLHLVERIKLGTTHAETGAYLLSLWGIPYTILEAVAWHHFPSESKEKTFTPLTAVHVANVAAHRRACPDDPKSWPPLDERYIADLNAGAQVDEWLKCEPEKPARPGGVSAQPYVVRDATPVEHPISNPIPGWVWIASAAVVGLFLFLIFKP